MIEKPCYICGSTNKSSVVEQSFADSYLSLIDPALNHRHPERAIVRCERCGFLFHSPTLTDSEIEILYRNFRDTTFRDETPDEYFDRITSYPKDESLNYQKTLKLNELSERFLPAAAERTIYDVGSGGGVFLKTFLDHAVGTWRAYGCEPTPCYAELTRRRLGIPVETGFYRPGLHGIRFDLITAIKVVEHTVDPIAFLQGFHKDLCDDGMVYIEVPNSRELFRLPPDHDQLLYTHLYFFSPPVFEYVANRAGFEIVWAEEPESPGGEVDICAVLKKNLEMEARQFSFPLHSRKDLREQARRDRAAADG